MLKPHLALRLYMEIYGGAGKTDRNQSFLEVFTQKYRLSNQESEIISYLSDGVAGEEICRTLFISTSTLKKHISNIYKKVGVKNRGAFYTLVMEEKKKQQ